MFFNFFVLSFAATSYNTLQDEEAQCEQLSTLINLLSSDPSEEKLFSLPYQYSRDFSLV